MVATLNILSRNQVIAYVGQHAAEHGLDAAAVLAVANHEGLNTAPGSSWQLPHEGNISFGPPSWFGNGAGAALLARFGNLAPAWAWTPDGLDYWLQQVAQSARGLTGVDAIRAIVTGFERPRANLVPGEIANAQRDYTTFQQAIGTIQVPTLPGQVQPPTQAPLPAEAQPSTTVSVDPGMLRLGQVGPVAIGAPSGLLLGLLAIVLLVIGAIAMNGRENNMQIMQAAAVA